MNEINQDREKTWYILRKGCKTERLGVVIACCEVGCCLLLTLDV